MAAVKLMWEAEAQLHISFNGIFMRREKEESHSYLITKGPTLTEKSRKQRDNIKKRHQKLW